MEVYFDNAATSYPKPECVYTAVEEFMRRGGASPGRGSYPRAQESERIVLRLRSALARLLGVQDPARIILTFNSTDALNLALKGWLRRGDHVVLTDLEHNAVLRPLWALRGSRRIELTVVNASSHGEVNPDDVARAVTPRTRLIVCVHASNVLGTVQPIAEIACRAHERGIPILVDGSQSAGALPLNIEDLGIDMFAFTGHKSLLGLPGTGGLFLRHGLELIPLREGGTGSHSEELHQPASSPERYEAGTPNILGLAGLLAGVEFLLQTGVQRIRAREIELTRRLMEKLREIEGLTIHGPDAEAKTGITSISFDALEPAEAGQILGKKFGIMVRTGIHCAPLTHAILGTQGRGTVRFSVGWANTAEQVDFAAKAVREIATAVYRRTPCPAIS